VSDLNKIYNALMAGKASNQALATWVDSADGRDVVRSRERELDEGLAAYRRLSDDLRDGRKHIEPPDNWKPTECYCSAPTCSPPCGFCTDPANNEEESEG
jgi:hypothetical protein